MADRSPADVLADALAIDLDLAPLDDLDDGAQEAWRTTARLGLAALADAGYVISRPGDPWTDEYGQRWEVRVGAVFDDGSFAHLTPADDVEDPTDG